MDEFKERIWLALKALSIAIRQKGAILYLMILKQNMLNNLLTNPWVYWPEIVGATILLTFAMMLIKKEAVGKFLLKGIAR